jgi:uncharacterized peroxidase-related enzyme
MAHIDLPEGLPGIRGLLAFRPETAEPLCKLAEILMHTPGTLSPGERELIATYVSAQNDCFYCQTSHGAIAAYHLGGNEQLVADVKRNYEKADIPEKIKALLAIAGKVQQGGKKVQPEEIERARHHGATDLEIHDTVLIAAAFCMYNRYVDGLATSAPQDMASYKARAAQVAQQGYQNLPQALRAAVEEGWSQTV